MIDHRIFEYIKTLNKCRSFTEASKELYVAQPSLSRSIKALEDKLGAKLFDRSKIPLELTNAGERMLNYINEFEVLEAKMYEDFLKLSNSNKNKLTIGTLTYLGEYILPQIIPIFVDKNPDLVVDIQEHNGKTIRSALQNGDIDLCITNLPPQNEDVEYCTIAHDRLLLVTLKTKHLDEKFNLINNSVTNPLSLNFKDVENETFILLRSWQNMRIMAEEVFKSHNFNPKSIITTSSIASSLNLVNCQRGYAFICESALQHVKSNSPLAFFSLGPIENIASITFIYNNRIPGSPVDKFCNCAHEIFSENII